MTSHPSHHPVSPRATWLLGALLAAGIARAAGPDDPGGHKASAIDPQQARETFSEARALSVNEGGRLWGTTLYGPILLVDPETRAVVANEADTAGLLHAQGDLHVGTLPEDVQVSNTPTQWAGRRWTMLIWPLPPQPVMRRVMLAHEMFHRIQPQVGISGADSLCPHLDTPQGRLWMKLEWRALAAALSAHGAAQTTAIRDALAFRAHRHELFPGSAALEASQEIAEGVPEYTGTVAGTADADAARWRTIGRLADPEGDAPFFAFQATSISFVRTFAYVSGPPYGLLLDERLPGWRRQVTAHPDLAALLASTVPPAAPVSAVTRAAFYGESSIRLTEDDREAKAEARRTRYRSLLVDGPTLRIPGATQLRYSFNPSALVSLDQTHVVYPTFHATDDWGTLEVQDGVLVTSGQEGIHGVTLAAPADVTGGHIHGPGWTLDLAPGWHILPAGSPGSYTLHKD